MNGNAQAAILEIQTILDSIPNLKQILTSLKEGAIQLNSEIRDDYPYTMAFEDRHSSYRTNDVEIRYVMPRNLNGIRQFNEYIRNIGGDTYYIYGRIGGRNNVSANILIKNGISSLSNANTYKASKNYIRINVRGGGRRRNKHTKKDRKHRNRTRKHRS